MSRRPTPAQLQQSADAWNQQNPIGTPVIRYKLIQPLREPEPTVTTSAAWVMGGHSLMVKVQGVSGCVLTRSLTPVPHPVPHPGPACGPCEQLDYNRPASHRYTSRHGNFFACAECAAVITRLQITFPDEFTEPVCLPATAAA